MPTAKKGSKVQSRLQGRTLDYHFFSVIKEIDTDEWNCTLNQGKLEYEDN